MKAEELMIGDWYQWYADGKYYYYQVTKETFNNDEDTIANFEPIPLTPEILEENGYKRESFGKYSCNTFPEDTHYRLEISIEGTDIWWSINYDEYHILKLQYVHELQHALRMCNIDLEIKNDLI